MPLEYYSESELKHQARQERRRRLLSGVRGWLYETRSPRWLTSGLLAVSLIAGSGVVLAAIHFGLRSIPWLCFIGIITGLPVFIWLVRWQAGRMAACLDAMGDARKFIFRDEAMEREDFADTGFPSEESLSQFFRKTSSEAAGKGGLPAVLAIGLLTLGMWLIWDLVKSGPTLLSEAFVDGVFPRSHPRLAEPLHTEPWLQNAVIATCVHFGGLAFCASGVALVIVLFRPPNIAG